MQKKLLAGLVTGLLLSGIAGTADAGLLIADSVSGTGSFNSINKINDGIFPPEWEHWTANTTWWSGTGPQFTFDYGDSFIIEDVIVSVDNNDSYQIDYSIDNITWNNLFSISSGNGEVGSGMDTMSTIFGAPEYISALDFTAVTARYLRIFATGGDNSYSVGEFQAYSLVDPVPEPATMLLFGTGLAVFSGMRLRKKKR